MRRIWASEIVTCVFGKILALAEDADSGMYRSSGWEGLWCDSIRHMSKLRLVVLDNRS